MIAESGRSGTGKLFFDKITSLRSQRASMFEIRARIGGSKATLDNYFPSKEKLFFEVMYQATESELVSITAALNPEAAGDRFVNP